MTTEVTPVMNPIVRAAMSKLIQNPGVRDELDELIRKANLAASSPSTIARDDVPADAPPAPAAEPAAPAQSVDPEVVKALIAALGESQEFKDLILSIVSNQAAPATPTAATSDPAPVMNSVDIEKMLKSALVPLTEKITKLERAALNVEEQEIINFAESSKISRAKKDTSAPATTTNEILAIPLAQRAANMLETMKVK